MRNKDCVVLVPVYSATEPETQANLDILASRGYTVRLLRGASQVDLARSAMATEAIRDGFKETFWIDADTGFNPDDVDRIRRLGLPFVAGMYPCKGPKRFAGKFKPDTGKVKFGIGGGLLEVEFVGMGFTFVRADVYRKLADGLPECNGGYAGKTVVPYFIPMLAQDHDRPCYLSEDYSFCIRGTSVGFPPVVDTRIKVGHISGKKTYTWNDLLPDWNVDSLEVEMNNGGEIVATQTEKPEMIVNTNGQEMVAVIGTQTLRINQLENENASLRESLEQAKADIETAKLAGEQDARTAKQLADELKAARNGVVADVTG